MEFVITQQRTLVQQEALLIEPILQQIPCGIVTELMAARLHRIKKRKKLLVQEVAIRLWNVVSQIQTAQVTSQVHLVFNNKKVKDFFIVICLLDCFVSISGISGVPKEIRICAPHHVKTIL